MLPGAVWELIICSTPVPELREVENECVRMDYLGGGGVLGGGLRDVRDHDC